MFGYRLFKVGGSMLILLLTQWTAFATDIARLGWAVMVICLIWMLVLYYLRREYLSITAHRTWATDNA